VRFVAIEHVLPSRQVTNDEVLAAVRAASAPHLPDEDLTIVERLLRGSFDTCGTTVRYHRAPGETAFDLAVQAGEQALATAGLRPDDIDLLIFTGVCRAVVEPAAATAFQARLGLRHATAFDVADACASWARCLELAHHLTATGAYRRIMILNAEFGGDESHRYELRSLDEYLHWHPGVTVGEAATATVLVADDEPDHFETDFRTYGDQWRLCYVPLANAPAFFGAELPPEDEVVPMRFVSHGLRLMRFATAKLIEHYRDRPQFEQFKPDLIFGHAASDGMSRYVAEQCGMDLERYQFTHRETANTVSATVPLAMSRAIRAGRLRDGDRVLLVVASSGVTTALTKFVYRS
jgi:3-oxoacyl-[acyl-carrier-protein] synthase III